MIERVIAVLLAVLASLGLVQPAEAVPGTSAPVAGHAYDDAEQSSAVIYTATERGPPGAADATYDAVVLGSHGASPRAASASASRAGVDCRASTPTRTRGERRERALPPLPVALLPEGSARPRRDSLRH
mgnify:CR=1 FL=1